MKQSRMLTARAMHAVNLEDVGGASLILTNGRICTGTGTAEAIAIEKHGVIVAVGDANMIAQYKVSDTKVIDLSGDTVLPGLHDMHVHPMGAGLGQARCNFPQANPGDRRQVCEGKTEG
jgi:predicted amidohydrolase YtcJ